MVAAAAASVVINNVIARRGRLLVMATARSFPVALARARRRGHRSSSSADFELSNFLLTKMPARSRTLGNVELQNNAAAVVDLWFPFN